MKLIARQKIWLAVVITANLLLWIIPSDVLENIVRDRHTLLGRYSREHLWAMLGLLLFSAVSFYVDWSTGETYKRRWFQVIASLMFACPALLLVDFVTRPPDRQHYVRDSVAYHRPARFAASLNYVDRPKAARSYPNAPGGYPDVACTLTTDENGYRNRSVPDCCDIIVLGDSFAEGSSVSDEHVWPVLLARETGLSVYNLGMSGYAPMHYLASLTEHGLALHPKIVLCGLYEGNDFRSSKSDRKNAKPGLSKRAKAYFKQSPLITALDHWMVSVLGPINSDGAVAGIEMLDWLPLTIPPGPYGKRYAFAPKQLRDMYEPAEQFKVDKHWLNPRRQLEEMNRLCQEAGAGFIVVYCPLKAHVTLPPVIDSIPAEKIRALLALRSKQPLPPADEFVKRLIERSDDRESVVAQWCRRERIPFISLTGPLRDAACNGTQVYYTYDQHWTPAGHAAVADEVARFLPKPTAAHARAKGGG
ncbi:MAG: SGNH/GDSL hydrolase family protein [Phycisphaerae bacterium]